jgi:formylmethanofuran dehydrogenase subunit E
MRVATTISWALLLVGCASQAAPSSSSSDLHAVRTGGSEHHSPVHQPTGDSAAGAAALEAIRGVHGGAGPWVVAGYRMGKFALARLRLPRGSFDLEVVHHSPREVQFSCIADGAAAATGASLGRLNLSLEPAAAQDTRTTYRNRQTGASVTLETTEEFAQRYADLPRTQLSAAGVEVLQLQDAQIFRELH